MRTRGLLSHPVWGPLQQLQGEMNRVFDRWFTVPGAGNGVTGFPAVNMWEEDDQVLVEAELPGQDLKSLEVFVTGGNQLTLKCERKFDVPEKGLWHRQERGHGVFSRTLTLPYLVDPDRVEAKLENGVLLVRLAKHESARPRKIAIKAQ
jgi:HSP20 family protein